MSVNDLERLQHRESVYVCVYAGLRRTLESTSYMRKPEFKLVRGVSEGAICVMVSPRSSMMQPASTYPSCSEGCVPVHDGTVVCIEDL